MYTNNEISPKATKNVKKLNFYHVLKPIETITGYVGLCPFTYVDGRYVPNTSRSLFIRQISFMVVSLLWVLLVVRVKFTYIYNEISPILVAVELIQFAFHLVMVDSFWISTMIYKGTMTKIIQIIHDVDDRLKMYELFDYEKDKRKTFLIILVTCCGILLLFVWDFFIWMNAIGFDKAIYDTIRYWTVIVQFSMLLLLHKIPQWLTQRFKIINMKLISIMQTFIDNGGMKSVDSRKQENSELKQREVDLELQTRVQIVGKSHALLSDVVDYYSRAYGYLMVFLYVDISILIVSTGLLNMLLIMGRSPFKFDLAQTLSVGIVWCIVLGGQAVLLDINCVAAKEQASNTLYVAQRMLIDIPASKEPNRRYSFRDELLMLVRQISRRPTEFTADGFFVLDLDLIYSIAIAIITYLVVLLQMHIQYDEGYAPEKTD